MSSDSAQSTNGIFARHRKKIVALLIALAIGPVIHLGITLGTPMDPPKLAAHPAMAASESEGIRRLGPAYTRKREGVREVYVRGSAEEIGAEHVGLLRDQMIENEGVLWNSFAHFVPVAPARALMMDIGRFRYRHVDEGMPEARLREIAAGAEAFAPDPFDAFLPTYHRMVFLHALYDIALSFEHSPLIGCSAFVLGPEATKDGHTILGRAFDFEAGDVFDREKAVFFVAGDGAIPFASVAWPGLIGVMSGMNLEGVTIIVNGGRAREPRTTGEPVVFLLRDVLERAHDTAEAVAILRAQSVMVSHLVLVTDAKGVSAAVERAPGAEAYVRPLVDPNRVPLTNHFEGPLAHDERNETVLAHTTTIPRRERLDELLASVGPHEGSVEKAVSILRDHTCFGTSCALGDRRAIDALIATHGIVADATDRVLWVSAGPHLAGKFVRFDLRAIFAPDHDPRRDPPPETIPEDPILIDGRYATGRAHAGGPVLGGDAK